MRNRVILAAVAAALSLATAASAATMTGTVRTYEPDTRQFVLENGYRYLLSPSAQAAIKAGDRVTITWNRIQNGIRVAQIVRVENQPANSN